MKNKGTVVICCPTAENMTKKDLKEIRNLLGFKKRYKEYLRGRKENE